MTRPRRRLGRGMKEIREQSYGSPADQELLAILSNPHVRVVAPSGRTEIGACPLPKDPQTAEALLDAARRIEKTLANRERPVGYRYEEAKRILFGVAKRRTPEHDLQKAFFARVRGLQRLVPELALCHAPKTDFKRTGKPQDFGRWNYLRSEGVVSGVPDVCLPWPINGRHCFYMELKAKGKRPEPHQAEFHDLLRSVGITVHWTDDLERAWDFLLQYVGPVLRDRKIEIKGVTF